MATPPDLAALMLTPDQLGELLGRLAAGRHGVTLCARVAGAQQQPTGLALHLQDALLHVGPAPLSAGAAAPAGPGEP